MRSLIALSPIGAATSTRFVVFLVIKDNVKARALGSDGNYSRDVYKRQIGSCVPFVVSLALIFGADYIGISGTVATAGAFIINALWWAVVTIPLLKNYKQNYYMETKTNGVKETVKRLGTVCGEIRNDKKVFLFLVAFFFYIDGVYTVSYTPLDVYKRQI